jgi:hypothetical protein
MLERSAADGNDRVLGCLCAERVSNAAAPLLRDDAIEHAAVGEVRLLRLRPAAEEFDAELLEPRELARVFRRRARRANDSIRSRLCGPRRRALH